MALALGRKLEETAEMFAEIYAPDSPVNSASGATMTACALDEPFAVAELRAALRLLRRYRASDPDGISDKPS